MTAIRAAEPYDLSRLMAFDSFPGERIAEIVDRRMLVAEVDGIIAGYIAWQTAGCIGMDYVNKLVVDPHYRRQSIAQSLIRALNSALTGRVFISTGEDNLAAIRLLAVTEWRPAGQIVGLRPAGTAEIFYYRDL